MASLRASQQWPAAPAAMQTMHHPPADAPARWGAVAAAVVPRVVVAMAAAAPWLAQHSRRWTHAVAKSVPAEAAVCRLPGQLVPLVPLVPLVQLQPLLLH